MVKTYHKCSTMCIFWLLIGFLGIVGFAYLLVLGIIDIVHYFTQHDGDIAVSIFVISISLLSGFVFFWEILIFFTGCIKLDEDKIFSNGEIKNFKKIQYPAKVKYIDIIEITVMVSRNATNGKYLNLSRPVPFLKIKTRNNKSVRFSLSFMASITLKRLLTDLKRHMKELGNDLDFDINKLVNDFKKAKFAV